MPKPKAKKVKSALADLVLADVSELDDEALSTIETKIRTERSARWDREQAAIRAKEIEFNNFIFKNKKQILKMVPDHVYNRGCTDKEKDDSNEYPVCARCAILHLESWQLDDLRIKFEASVERVSS